MALNLHTCGPQGVFVENDLTATEIAPGVVWIDLVRASKDEVAFVERATGLQMPTLADLAEIETSSRLYVDGGAIYLSTPAVYRANTTEPVTTPLGFVLTPRWLITIRFEPLPVFDIFKGHAQKPTALHPGSAGAFAGLVEAIVDRLADVLERTAAELDVVSHSIFRAKSGRGRKRRAPRAEADLRATIDNIGGAGDLISKVRESLLGLNRIVPFVAGRADWASMEIKQELETIRLDLLSLNDYDAYLNSKVGFLLDATLGLINIEQNNVIKVLTVATIVFVPPTLIASWYGMNFKHLPELDWDLGYPYAIALSLLSAIIPLVWLKRRGWF